MNMNFFRNIRSILAALLLSCSSAWAAPHIGFLMPSGAQQGTTVDIIIGGQGFWQCREAFISGKGITVESVEFVPGLPNVSAGGPRTYTGNSNARRECVYAT